MRFEFGRNYFSCVLIVSERACNRWFVCGVCGVNVPGDLNESVVSSRTHGNTTISYALITIDRAVKESTRTATATGVIKIFISTIIITSGTSTEPTGTSAATT